MRARGPEHDIAKEEQETKGNIEECHSKEARMGAHGQRPSCAQPCSSTTFLGPKTRRPPRSFALLPTATLVHPHPCTRFAGSTTIKREFS